MSSHYQTVPRKPRKSQRLMLVDFSSLKAWGSVNNMAKTAAFQLAGTGIRVNSICPGLIEVNSLFVNPFSEPIC